MAYACAAIAVYGRAEQTEVAQFVHDLPIKTLVQRSGNNARQKLVLRIGFRCIADHPLFIGQLRVEVKGIIPSERCKFSHKPVCQIWWTCSTPPDG